MTDELTQTSYVSLATYRKSGQMVATPVWMAEQDGLYYVFSAGNAGKVKRLRNSPRARLAKCDVRGKLLGEWHDAEAELVDAPDQIQRALGAFRKKYGLQMWLADAGSKLTGKFNKRAYIAVRLVTSQHG